MTPNPDFKVTPLFDADYLRNGSRYTVFVRLQWNRPILIGRTHALTKSVISNDLE